MIFLAEILQISFKKSKKNFELADYLPSARFSPPIGPFDDFISSW